MNIQFLPQRKHNAPRLYKSQLAVVLQIVFTQCKLTRAIQMPTMSEQTFNASYEKFDRFNFEASCDFHYTT
jgi:hypothetical protein